LRLSRAVGRTASWRPESYRPTPTRGRYARRRPAPPSVRRPAAAGPRRQVAGHEQVRPLGHEPRRPVELGQLLPGAGLVAGLLSQFAGRRPLVAPRAGS
jgi:hypothetical protein